MSSRLIRANTTGPQNPLYITGNTYFYYNPTTGTLSLYVTGSLEQTWQGPVPPTSPGGLLLENGDFILLESGDILLKEA